MRTTTHARLSPPAAALRERWGAESLCTGWPAPADAWQCAAVDAVCAALVWSGGTGPDLHDAVRSLGEQRAEVGTRLSEARADLGIALALTGLGPPRRRALLDVLAVAWAERAADFPVPPMVDATSDMASSAYLILRLGELYREAALTGRDVSAGHLLVGVETVHTGHRLVADARLAALHSALRYAFVGGESIVAVTSRRLLALAGRDEPRLSDSLARLRSELKIALAEGRLPGARMWQQPLPRSADELPLIMNEVLE